MPAKQIIPFKITSMDSLGQGVSKETGQVVFIPKTALGDEGTAEIISQRKGVIFAQIHSLNKKSELRVQPLCPHYEKCPSCHFLHTDYETEINVKKESLERLFRKQVIAPIKIIKAVRRVEYRNRIQLHYDKSKKLLGMLDARHNLIIPIPSCSIGLPGLNKAIKDLYQDDHWLKLVSGPQQGHVELYLLDENMKLSWNRPYAEGGFTQVFEEMNEKLKNELTSWQHSTSSSEILDLFAGNGNLSKNFKYSRRLAVDIYPDKTPGEEFLSQNLYDKKVFSVIQTELKKRQMTADFLLLDPPRSGFKELDLWLAQLRPKFAAYVSCDAHTLARDLATLSGYSIIQVFLVDFFPSTFHFETMVFLERKD